MFNRGHFNRKGKDCELGKFITNTTEPDSLEGVVNFCYSSQGGDAGESEMNKKWDQWINFIEKNIIGPPKATERHTTQSLQRMNMVGIYTHPE